MNAHMEFSDRGEGCGYLQERDARNDVRVLAYISEYADKSVIPRIVRACNAHDDLVAALSDLLRETDAGQDACGREFVVAARAALAKAGAA